MPASRGTWSEIEVAGHVCQTYEPPDPSPHQYVVVYLHGVHHVSLREHPAFAAEFDRYGLRVIIPQTKRSWWTDKVCEEFDLEITAERYVMDYVVPEIASMWDAKPPRIGMLGINMGGQGALRFGFRHPNVFPVIAAISPEVDFHLRFRDGDESLLLMYPDQEAARQDTAILHIHPLNWPRNIWFCCDPEDHRWHNSSERLRMKLAALGIPFECDLDQMGGGHSFTYYNRMAPQAVKFVAESLDRERLRIV